MTKRPPNLAALPPTCHTVRQTLARWQPRRQALALALARAVAMIAGAGSAVVASAQTTERIEVIGASPLPGQGIDRNLLPYGTQVVRRPALDEAQAANLTDYLARRMPGMQVNDIQGSPLQADLTYRGFRASGLLGASQGLAVFLDGVRVNEPFGDVVNWDMVPEFALQSVAMLPGANPAYGLNTLGGAMALATTSGQQSPGLKAEFGLGSHGRRRAEVGYGRQLGDGWHGWVGGTSFDEVGWRAHSPGRQAMAFAKLGHAHGDGAWDVSLLAGRSTLVGNGLVPAATLHNGVATPDLYASDRSAVYTHPDRSRNTLLQLTLHAEHDLDNGVQAQALLYLRRTRRDTVNGDVADPTQHSSTPVAGNGEVAAAPASMNNTATRQSAWGAAASVGAKQGDHQWRAGASIDANVVQFQQTEQEGWFDAGRGVSPGVQDAEMSAAVDGRAQMIGLYATDTWRVAPATHVTATLRWNQARVSNRLTSVDDNTDVLTARDEESFRWTSLNPALGVTQQVSGGLTLFANLARNSRVPTAIELGCADPLQPCRLPAGLQSDPYLNQVRATSIELGARWKAAPGQQVELSIYRTDNRDDIVFASLGATSQLGYFRNIERTRHQGLDLQWQGKVGALELSAAYSLLAATYQTTTTLRMGDRNVHVTPGMRMAGLPRQTLKFGADWRATPTISLGADLQAVARRGVLGNEDGLTADGAAASQPLSVPGHALLHLRAQWQWRPGWTLLGRVQNVFDRGYENYGALGSTSFDAQGRYTGIAANALFVAPGAPRSVFVGLRVAY